MLRELRGLKKLLSRVLLSEMKRVLKKKRKRRMRATGSPQELKVGCSPSPLLHFPVHRQGKD